MCLGIIRLERKRAAEAIAREVRIKEVEAAHGQIHANLLMVTSVLAGEGKSFTSINLALSIAAELDNTVMLVDADVARPSVLRMLGLPPKLLRQGILQI